MAFGTLYIRYSFGSQEIDKGFESSAFDYSVNKLPSSVYPTPASTSAVLIANRSSPGLPVNGRISSDSAAAPSSTTATASPPRTR
jgi:hypothetical protein